MSTKKSKTEVKEDADKVPYVHVRARRGQATDSHSLAERVISFNPLIKCLIKRVLVLSLLISFSFLFYRRGERKLMRG